jgi:hypothetical protein
LVQWPEEFWLSSALSPFPSIVTANKLAVAITALVAEVTDQDQVLVCE